MKILIVGECSGFARHLKNGFCLLGHDVTIVQSGDGWKALAQDNDIIVRDQVWKIKGHRILGSNRILAVINNLKTYRVLKNKCHRPDLIIVVNYEFLSENVTDAGVSRKYISQCIKKGAKLIMSECGTSPAGAYFDKEYYQDLLGKRTPLKDGRYTYLLNNSDVIIPTAYCYYDQLMAYEKICHYDTKKVTRAIPLPITINNDAVSNSCEGRKIVVFHGVIRPKAKGTPFIEAAMDRLQEEYPEKVKCICRGGIPYDEYVKLFDRVDILIDQTYLNGWGMNAIIGAMKGKCVLTSCGPENGENMGIDKIPFVRITPDVEQIHKTLKALVENPKRIESVKKQSRKFAEEYCDSVIVAKRYIASVDLI